MGWQVNPPSDARAAVTARFIGHLTADEGKASAAAFRAAFQGEPLEVVWDLTKMTGFESGARNAWADAVWPLRGQIRRLKIIGAHGVVRAGATFLALLLRRPYEFVESEQAESNQAG